MKPMYNLVWICVITVQHVNKLVHHFQAVMYNKLLKAKEEVKGDLQNKLQIEYHVEMSLVLHNQMFYTCIKS